MTLALSGATALHHKAAALLHVLHLETGESFSKYCNQVVATLLDQGTELNLAFLPQLDVRQMLDEDARALAASMCLHGPQPAAGSAGRQTFLPRSVGRSVSQSKFNVAVTQSSSNFFLCQGQRLWKMEIRCNFSLGRSSI